MRVEDDRGAGSLCVELPLLRDPRCLGPWRRTDDEGEEMIVVLRCEQVEDVRRLTNDL